MDLLLEPALKAIEHTNEPPGQMAGRSLDEWNDAYVMVESYFHALQVRNKLLLGQLVNHVLTRAVARATKETQRPATELAVEEMDNVVNEWFAEVLHESSAADDDMLSTRGRMALLLADMPGKWQDQFLRPPPWDEEFAVAMREAYLKAGPDFQLSKMVSRPLDLGPIATLNSLGRLPVFKFVALSTWVIFALIFLAIFLMTH